MTRRPVVLVVQHAAAGADLAVGLEADCIMMRASAMELGYDIARAKSPDLIAVDVSVASQAAWTLCRLLKRDPATASIPVVILNAPKTQDSAAHAQFIGASAVFSSRASAGEWLAAARESLRESSAA